GPARARRAGGRQRREPFAEPGSAGRDRKAAGGVRQWLSIFFVGGMIAYRGLFNWIRPALFIPTMLGSPLFQLIFFTKLGEFAHAESRDFYIVGNATQVCAMSAVYGMTMAVPNDRS